MEAICKKKFSSMPSPVNYKGLKTQAHQALWLIIYVYSDTRQVWWHIPIVLESGRMRHRDSKFKVILGYTVRGKSRLHMKTPSQRLKKYLHLLKKRNGY